MPGCEHTRTEFLMRRDGVDYLRCMQCDSVFESEDLEQTPAALDDDAEQTVAPNHPHNHQHNPQRGRKKAS